MTTLAEDLRSWAGRRRSQFEKAALAPRLEEIGRVVTEARARWPVDGIVVIHRHGLIRPGEPIVLVATTSRHRSAAFAAAEFLMDFLKTRAPFWKKSHAVKEPAEWVAAKEEDDTAAARWGEQ